MPHIAVVTPCYNEEGNVIELYNRIGNVFKTLPGYTYDHVYIDNCSTDGTVKLLRELAARDRRVKVICNVRNFGHIRSPMYGITQAQGDATILMVSDLQDPPEMIPDLIKKWEEGFKVVACVKEEAEESPLFFAVRKAYYNLVSRIAEIKLIKNFTGFGLYDKQVIDIIRGIDDPYPYFRGLICDIGFETAILKYKQPLRKRGFTKNNFYTLYDMAMLGIINHSRLPLRMATISGFIISAFSIFIAVGYLIAKLIAWQSFTIGVIPLVVGVFFLGGINLFFTGIIGEYVGTILTQVQKRPLVIERERINFDVPATSTAFGLKPGRISSIEEF